MVVRRFLRGIRKGLQVLSGGKKQEPEKPLTPPAPLHSSRPAARVKAPAQGPRRDSAHAASGPAPAAREKAWSPSDFHVEPKEGHARFQDLDLPPEILHGIADLGFKYCTPIQAGILPKTLEGTDAAGRAQTGTGKTAAFLITIFTRLLRGAPQAERRPGSPRVLILAPTRELVIQIEKEASEIGRHCPFTTMAVFGGMDFEKQKRQLAGKRIDIVVATPGRLLDFQRRHVLHLSHVEILVIDEADRMLDMGFIPDVRSIVHSTPPKSQRQTMFFSATLTSDVLRLAGQWTRDPAMVEIERDQVEVKSVDQVVYIITADQKFSLLYNMLTQRCKGATLIFANRRDESRRLMERLRDYGIRCAVLSGDVPQEKRLRILEDFRNGVIPVVVATDVAGRGLHVEGIGHVINYNLPEDPEDYVHRIGRTGRAGATGTSISFACEEDSFAIPDIEKFLGHALSCTRPDDELLIAPPPIQGKTTSATHAPPPRARHGSGRPGGAHGGRRGGRPGSSQRRPR